MNQLCVGNADFTEHFLQTPEPFILIDDGPIAAVFLKTFPDASVFSPRNNSFNPLSGIDYKRARDFASILYTAAPEGKDTLTVRNGRRALARLVLNSSRLDRVYANETDPGEVEALATIKDALFSPTLKRVLCPRTRDFPFKGSVIAKIDRAELGDTDAFLLALLLIQQHKGQVIVPDFGFYGRDFHMSLIRQNRLTAGVHFLDELSPKLQKAMLLIKDKQYGQCTWEDAEVLALYKGLQPHTTSHTEFLQRATEWTHT